MRTMRIFDMNMLNTKMKNVVTWRSIRSWIICLFQKNRSSTFYREGEKILKLCICETILTWMLNILDKLKI